MSETYIPKALRKEVIDRAKNCCEYCLLPDWIAFLPHEIDHIIAEKHGGQTTAENLAFTCWRCNRNKGSDLGTFDPQTGEFAFFFHPRTQVWEEHFQLNRAELQGKTPEGRATVHLLKLNSSERVQERQRLSRY